MEGKSKSISSDKKNLFNGFTVYKALSYFTVTFHHNLRWEGKTGNNMIIQVVQVTKLQLTKLRDSR